MRRATTLVASALTLCSSPALACGTPREHILVDWADVVVDGVAVCDMSEGSCILRARTVVKDNSSRPRINHAYRFHFDPGATARFHKRLADEQIIDCAIPWEPESERIEGRFYLKRENGQLEPLRWTERGEEEQSLEGDAG